MCCSLFLADAHSIPLSDAAESQHQRNLRALVIYSASAYTDLHPAQEVPMAGPLTGIKVVEFTEYIAGPYAGMLLADMGADVVKVERPEGDEWRHTAPVAPMEGRGHLSVNRGKRGVSVDLETEDGREIARRLCETADIVLVGYRPGVAERFGLDYDAVAAIKPDVIYCENSAFGREGPYAGRPGFDILSQAATGMITYENKIERGLPTFIYTLAVADISTGMFLAYSAVCAILHRNLTGRGQRIETSLFASGLAAQTRPLLSVEDVDGPVREGFLAELRAARERGDVSFDEASKLRADYIPRRGRNNYYRVYETRDSLIAIACLNNRQRRAFRDLAGRRRPDRRGQDLRLVLRGGPRRPQGDHGALRVRDQVAHERRAHRQARRREGPLRAGALPRGGHRPPARRREQPHLGPRPPDARPPSHARLARPHERDDARARPPATAPRCPQPRSTPRARLHRRRDRPPQRIRRARGRLGLASRPELPDRDPDVREVDHTVMIQVEPGVIPPDQRAQCD